MLHTLANKFFLFLCSLAIDLTNYQETHRRKYLYYNHLDKCLDITEFLGDKLLERPKTDFCISSKEVSEYCVMTVIGKQI